MNDKTKITIKDLQYTNAVKQKAKEIQKDVKVTRRRDQLRELLGGPMCCVCWKVPTKRVEYDLSDLRRVECYCEKCYNEVYLNTVDVSNDSLAERYGCVKAKQP